MTKSHNAKRKHPSTAVTLPQLEKVSPSNKPRFMTPTHLDITRTSRRPTVAFNQQFNPHRLQEVILGIFRRNCESAIDLEALIHFTLHEFEVNVHTYEHMYKTVRAHVLKNFAIHQGSSLRLCEVAMRRVTVCHTIEKDQE